MKIYNLLIIVFLYLIFIMRVKFPTLETPVFKPKSLVELDGWNLESCVKWPICDPPTCSARDEKRIELGYPKRTVLNTPTVQVIHDVMLKAWMSHPYKKIDLYVRTGCGALRYTKYLLESVYLFWPRFLGDVILVLDYNDRAALRSFIHPELEATHSYKVVYEHVPCLNGRLFNQYSYLNAFRYSDAEYVVTIDSDCVFHTPVTPELLFDPKGKLWLPSSMKYQHYFPWDETQKFFTKHSHAPLGHPMITQPVNFHVNSTFEPYLKSVKPCYEQRLVDFTKSKLDQYWFCWMCQLKTFVVESNLTHYNVLFMDKTTTPYHRYAAHVKWELVPVSDVPPGVDRYHRTVDVLFNQSIARLLGTLTTAEVAEPKDFLRHVSFTYAHQELNYASSPQDLVRAWDWFKHRFQTFL